jgi:hypothetical protein
MAPSNAFRGALRRVTTGGAVESVVREDMLILAAASHQLLAASWLPAAGSRQLF